MIFCTELYSTVKSCTYSVVTEGAGKGVAKEDSCANHFKEGGKIKKQKQVAVFQKRKDFSGTT